MNQRVEIIAYLSRREKYCCIKTYLMSLHNEDLVSCMSSSYPKFLFGCNADEQTDSSSVERKIGEFWNSVVQRCL